MALIELKGIPPTVNFRTAYNLPDLGLSVEGVAKGPPERFDTLYPSGLNQEQALLGEQFIASHPIHSIGIVPPNLPSDMVDMAIKNCKASKFKPNPNRHMIVASDEVAEKLRTSLPELTVFSSRDLEGLLKDEVYTLVGATPPQEETSGFYNLSALVVDRLVMKRNRGEEPFRNHIYDVGIGTDKVGASPIKLASALTRREGAIYIQKNKGAKIFNIGSSDLNRDNQLAQDISRLDLEPSSNIVIQPALLDRVPLITGNVQELITLIAAYQYAGVTGLPIGKILDEMGLRFDVNELIQQKQDAYEKLLKIIGEEVEAKGELLINITPERLKQINVRLKEYPQLGQLLPSVYDLLRTGMIDLDRVTEIEKQCHDKHRGIPKEVTDFMPTNMKQPGTTDHPQVLITELDRAQTEFGTQPSGKDLQVAVQTGNYQGYDVRSGTRHREAQFDDKPDPRKSLDSQLQGLFYFNRDNLYLEQEEAKRALVEPGREFLAAGNVVWILPGFVERFSIADVARYHERLIRKPGRVIVVSPDEGTRDAASIFCNVVLDQNEIMQNINWSALIEAGILPKDRKVPISGKGITILAGFLWAMAQGLITENTYVGHTDTDIANIDKYSIFYRQNPESRIPPYRAAEYMAAAAAKMSPNVQLAAIQPAKVGIERKSPVKHPVWMAMANSQDAALRYAGYQLGRVTWASPGEGLVLSETYSNYPWEATTGFDLDRYLKALLMELNGMSSSVDLDNRFRFAQVVVPPPKIEMGGVSESIDFQEVNWATFMYTIAQEFYQKWFYLTQAGVQNALPPALPPHYSIAHLGEVNREYAGRQLRVIAESSPETTRVVIEDPPMPGHNLGEGVIYYPYEELFGRNVHQPNVTGYRWAPWRLPPIPWMDKEGIINWEGIRNATNHSIVGQKNTRRGRWQ